MSSDTRPRIEPLLLGFCGIFGLIGSLAPTATMAWAGMVAEHDFLADTLSDLGRGPHRRIMDTGFFINAASLIALALAATQLHGGQKRWSGAILAMVLLALNIVAIALWDAFGRTAPDAGMSVHTQLTFGLAPLYFFAPLLMASVLRDEATAMARLFVVSAGLWAVFAVAFKLAPDWIDGGLEKIAVAATLLWTIPLSVWVTKQAFHLPSGT